MAPRDSRKTITEAEVEDSEEIVTPIEAGAQAQAEREFETQRKIPASCKKAIVSVNGKDVDEVLLPRHKRVA
jgi:vacuolar-type H+-ATPase subunit H